MSATLLVAIEETWPVTEWSTEGLYRAHRHELLSLARLVGGSAEVAEDAVHEVFASLHRRQPAIADGRELAYLRRAVLHQLRGGWRRRATATRPRAVPPSEAGASPETAALDAERRARIDAALQRLSVRQRECVVLRVYFELTVPEIAAQLGVSEGSVKSHLHRGRARLEAELAAEAEDLR